MFESENSQIVTNYTSEFTNEELNRIQNEFKRLEGNHYLDHGGTAQYADSQIQRIFSNLSTNLYCNPHTSKYTEDLIDQVRYKILQSFNTTTDEYSVIFTSGATAALKILAESFDFNDENDANDGNFIYLRDNHTSVLGMRELVATKNIQCIERNDFLSERFLKQIANKIYERNLFVYSAQCNFNGFKNPLDIIGKIQKSHSNTFVCLDAASIAATNALDLNKYSADFICLSFYKMFGYPTGLGALLVSKRGESTLRKGYYGGGTVKISLSDGSAWHEKRDALHERFEDGTIPFLSIISLLSGYETIQQLIPAGTINESMDRISRHCFHLCQYLYTALYQMNYPNGRKVVQLYQDTDFSSIEHQGGVISFNIMHDDGSYVGFAEINCMANIHNIIVRTGCFCNPGACQRQLGLTNDDVRKHFQAGHICGDGNDLIDGVPTGAVRVTVGYNTRKENIDALISMIAECYLNSSPVQRIKLEQTNNNILKTDEILNNLMLPELRQIKSKLYKTNLIDNSLERIDSAATKAHLIRTLNCHEIKLHQICVYPIKSCGAFRVRTQWPLTRRGLKYDREWMIVQSNGVVMTQKTDTKLCLIHPIINEEENFLKLHFPHAEPIQIPLNTNMDNNKTLSLLCQTKVCGDRVDGIDCGDDVANWLEDVLCTSGLRLIKQNVDDKRAAKKKAVKDSTAEPQAISLANQAQYLLINMTSVDWLADKVEEWDDHNVFDAKQFMNMVDRFRGNLIVETPDALEELDWKYVKFGDVLFKVDGHCTRCQMICIDQNTGEKTTEPLRTIAREFQGKMRFGLYMGRGQNEGEVILECNKQVTICK